MDKMTAIRMMSALAQPTRLEVFLALAPLGNEGLPVGELASLVNTPPNTMSTHLAILSRAGLVAPCKSGRTVTYSADREAVQSLAVFLLESGTAPKD